MNKIKNLIAVINWLINYFEKHLIINNNSKNSTFLLSYLKYQQILNTVSHVRRWNYYFNFFIFIINFIKTISLKLLMGIEIKLITAMTLKQKIFLFKNNKKVFLFIYN